MVAAVEETGIVGTGGVDIVEDGIAADEVVAADGVAVDPPAAAAMVRPPTTAAADRPAMAMTVRGFFMTPHFLVG
jgi:hypothetical protein